MTAVATAAGRGVVAGAVVLAALLTEPLLGTLGPAFALLLVLPPLAVGLSAMGWRDRAAALLLDGPTPRTRVVRAYLAWLITSAFLTLDVAAVGAASVASASPRERPDERRIQFRAAVVGANTGSLLFPFSNLTNLVLVAHVGIPFATYVAAAAVPQVAAAVVGGALLASAASNVVGSPFEPEGNLDAAQRAQAERPSASDPASAAPGLGLVSVVAGLAVVVGSAVAVVFGFAGLDVVLPFTIATAVVVALAVASRRATPLELARSLPLSGLAVVAIAALLAAPLRQAADSVPAPGSGPVAMLVVAIVGAALATTINNLPAAAVGAFWLVGAAPGTVVAYLVGTNIAALLTPHGSVATMLVRSVAAAAGEPVSARRYLRTAWRFAIPPTVAALIVLILLQR